MSREGGWAALNMEFTEKVPRTEFSVVRHWPLIEKVTGINTSILENRPRAVREFVKKWDYGLYWHVYVHREHLEKRGRISKMGHANHSEEQDGKSDFSTEKVNAFEDLEEALQLDPWEEYGEFDKKTLIAEMEKDYEEMCHTFPDTLNMGGCYITLFSGLIEIFGWDMLLLALAAEPERFGKVIEGYYRWIKQFFEAYAESRVPVIMIHDDLCWTEGPAAHPEWYRKYIFPYMKKLMEPLKEADKKIIYTSDGNWTVFFDDIVDCGADMVFMEPCADMAAFAEKYGKTHGFVGNADTRVLLYGTKEDIYNEVKRCMDIGKKYPGFVMSVSNHIPPNTPVENALYYNEVYEKLSRR